MNKHNKLLCIGLFSEFLHPLLGFRVVHDLRGKFEEGSLESGVGVTAHATLGSELVRIDDVEFRLFLGEEVLHAVRS